MSPIKQFQENHKEDVKFLSDLIHDPRFQRCLQFAMLQHVRNTVTNPTTPDAFARIAGAQAFIHTLETLWMSPREAKPATPTNLDHKW